MKLKYLLILLLLIFCWNQTAVSQTRQPKELRKAYVAPDEIISVSSTMSFKQALDIFNDLSKKYLSKIIVDPENHSFSIGIDINNMHWLDAFEKILQSKNLWYEEYEDYIKVVKKEDGKNASREIRDEAISFNTREVAISALFFEADGSRLREAGMNWNFFRGKDLNLNMSMSAAEGSPSIFQIDMAPELDFGTLVALFQAMESDQIGEVVANPQVTVRSGQEGRIQVGSDFSVTVQDFAGNAITQFFSTGSIIRVTPLVIRKDSLYFIHLDLNVERSNATTSGLGIEIKKTSAQTSVLLLDGEETIIGGLYVNEEKHSREGIPILKNLPWWFFGLRYVFGYESKSIVKKDLLILLKADLVPTLKERMAAKSREIRDRSQLQKQKLEFMRKLELLKKK